MGCRELMSLWAKSQTSKCVSLEILTLLSIFIPQMGERKKIAASLKLFRQAGIVGMKRQMIAKSEKMIKKKHIEMG